MINLGINYFRRITVVLNYFGISISSQQQLSVLQRAATQADFGMMAVGAWKLTTLGRTNWIPEF